MFDLRRGGQEEFGNCCPRRLGRFGVGATQPVFVTAPDDDMTPVGHVSKSIKLGAEDNELPEGGPKRVDSAEKTTEDAPVKHPVSCSKSKKISEDANGKLLAAMAGLFDSMRATGTVDNLGSKMEVNVEEFQRRKDHDALEKKWYMDSRTKKTKEGKFMPN